MKRVIVYMTILLPILSLTDIASAQLFNKLKDEVKTDISNANKKGSPDAPTPSAAPVTGQSTAAPSATIAPGDAGDIKVYNNYDFVPGQTVLFEDNFMNEQDGEFPSKWKLDRGQGVMNILNGVNAFFLTDGNYAIVSPRMKSPSYLTDPFTLEFDYLVPQNGGYGLVCRFWIADQIADVSISGEGDVKDPHLSGSYPGDHTPAGFRNRWHHVAMAYKNNQLKVYVDQYRVLIDPDFGAAPGKMQLCAIADLKSPCIFTNVRMASGGGMNMIGKKFTDAKIITHGINFDYDKATLKPESAGTLNMIMKIMNGDPDVKFEVGGYTDGDGDAAHNMKLSQDRADAVRTQLVAMGIDGSRLTAKGYGKTKPIADNTTDDGKANNRRVEFVKN